MRWWAEQLAIGASAPAFLLAALLVLAPSTAAAEGEALTAVEAAELASKTLSEHCPDAAADDTEAYAASISAVAPALGRVAESLRIHGDDFLLYWTGVLAACISQEDKAERDLTAFVAAFDEDKGYASMVGDARRRLRRFGAAVPRRASSEGAGPGPAAAVLGVGAAVAGLGGVVHGATFGLGQPAEGEARSAGTPADFDSLQAGNRAGFGLLVGGAAVATVGVISLVATLAKGGGSPAAVLVVPTSGGVAITVAGTW